MKVEAYPFAQTATLTEPDILNGRTPQEFLTYKYQTGCMFGLENLKNSGCYRIHGWLFNFRPFLKRFVVKHHENWSEVWAPSRTALRKATYGRIQEIVLVTSRPRGKVTPSPLTSP